MHCRLKFRDLITLLIEVKKKDLCFTIFFVPLPLYVAVNTLLNCFQLQTSRQK